MEKVTYIIFFTMCICFQLDAQICEGNLGENIFTDGDFGSGAANILATDPGIAPGYGYQTNPPPNDGFYTITNNTSPWGSFASNWANITDNSPDPDGYMMVVNASFTPGLFYEQEVTDLCENTVFEFSADVYNLITGVGSIQPNVSFLLDGVVIYETGNIPPNQQWNTYGFSFTTGPNQTSITLALRNNAPGGSGNDLAIDNINFRACGPEALILPEEVANICEDGSPIDLDATINGNQYDTPVLQWQQSFDGGLTWENIPGATGLSIPHTDLTGGFYYYRYLLANDPAYLLNSKCRVISNVKVIHVVPKFYTIVDTLCEGLSFELGNNLYFDSGIYTDSLQTAIGCDSIVTLDLTILPDAGLGVLFDSTPPSCSYLLDGSISIESIQNGLGPYEVYINDVQVDYPGSLFNLGEESYDYRIVDQLGCSFETTINLALPDPFEIALGDDQQLELGETLVLDPFFTAPVAGYNWEPAELINCDNDCDILDFVPTQSAVYILTATSEEGCIDADSISVTVDIVRKIYIPNAFSPNDDGLNDYFTIYADVPNVQEIVEWKIFDRWGGVLFEAYNIPPNDFSQSWDGKSKSDPMPVGIYSYYAKVRFLDEVIDIYEGDITLIR